MLATVLGSIAAGLAIAGFLWARVVRPTIRAFRHYGDLLDQLLEILRNWPAREVLLTATAQQLTELAVRVGAVEEQQRKQREDLQELWRRHRAHSQHTHREGRTP